MYRPCGIKLTEEGHFFQFTFLFNMRVDVALAYDVCVLLRFVDGKLYVFQVHCHFQS